MTKRKIVVAVTGASGAIYAKLLFEKLQELQGQINEVAIVMSDNAKTVWQFELDNEDYDKLPYKIYGKHDFMAPFASGSARFDTMVIIPCSMGTLRQDSSRYIRRSCNPRGRCHFKRTPQADLSGQGYAPQPHPHPKYANRNRSRRDHLSGNSIILQQTQNG